MYNLDTHHQSITVHVDSRHLSDQEKTDFIYKFDNNVITCPNDVDMIFKIDDIEMPVSKYNINEYNNNFKVYYPSLNEYENITIENGNYNAFELVDYLSSLGSYLTFKYDYIRNEIYFIYENEFEFTEDNTLEVFNLSNPSYNDTYEYYVSSSFVNLSGISSLYVHCPTISTSYLSTMYGNSGIVLKVPLEHTNGDVLVWKNNGSHFVKLHEKRLSSIEIKLTDENNNPLLLKDNTHFTLTFSIHFMKTLTPQLSGTISIPSEREIKEKKDLNKNKNVS